MKTLKAILPLSLLALTALDLLAADSLGTSFTYQGRLTSDGLPASGNYDLTFKLCDAANGGSLIAGPITNRPVVVANGMFRVELDFGVGVFTGDTRWLEVAVRSNGVTADFAVLAPRQALTPAPYALYAPAANAAAMAAAVAPASVTGAGIADGEVVRSLNTLHDAVTLAAGTNVSLASTGNRITISATPGTVVTNAGWGLSGNGGITTNNFLGTTDGMALELRVNGTRALRLEPNATSPNLIGGYRGNSADPGITGVAIGGGGYSAHENTALAGSSYGTIAGGNNNTIRGFASFIGGGRNNITGPGTYDSVIGGGVNNTNNGYRAALLGGQYNIVQTNSNHAFLGSGLNNEADGDASAVLGGRYNTAQGLTTLVLGGESNTVRSLSLGQFTFGATHSLVGAGVQNLVIGAHDAFLGGGEANTAYRADWSVIGGGSSNRVTADGTFVGGGQNNTNSGPSSSIAGGRLNRVENTSDRSFIGGGWSNVLAGPLSVVGGGSQNASGPNADFASIGGGSGNQATALFTTIAGGIKNVASGAAAAVPGGIENEASGIYSFAAGQRAKARHMGSFVWADSTSEDFASTDANQFLIRARTVGINTTNPAATVQIKTPPTRTGLGIDGDLGSTVGLVLSVDNHPLGFLEATLSSSWGKSIRIRSDDISQNYIGVDIEGIKAGGDIHCSGSVNANEFIGWSDRNRKTGLAPVKPSEILRGVLSLPISTWAFTNSTAVRHLGPMAQDFRAQFGLGPSPTGIATVDADGVALAAIQGLNQKLEAKNDALEKQVADLRAMVKALAEKVNAVKE